MINHIFINVSHDGNKELNGTSLPVICRITGRSECNHRKHHFLEKCHFYAIIALEKCKKTEKFVLEKCILSAFFACI